MCLRVADTPFPFVEFLSEVLDADLEQRMRRSSSLSAGEGHTGGSGGGLPGLDAAS